MNEGTSAMMVDIAKAMCLAKKHGCKLGEGDGTFTGCTEGNADMDACNKAAIGGTLEADTCCPVGKKVIECVGKAECMQIALGVAMTMDTSDTYKKAVEGWNAGCPDEVPKPA